MATVKSIIAFVITYSLIALLAAGTLFVAELQDYGFGIGLVTGFFCFKPIYNNVRERLDLY